MTCGQFYQLCRRGVSVLDLDSSNAIDCHVSYLSAARRQSRLAEEVHSEVGRVDQYLSQ